MLHLPEALLRSLEQAPGYEREAFEAVHRSGAQVTSIRLNPAKLKRVDAGGILDFPIGQPVPWSGEGLYLPERPSFTFDPLFHAGCYYVQEASSMFLEAAIRQTVDLSLPLRVLDLCAAPGGKSTLIQSLLSGDSLLVANEVIRGRAGILNQNIIKWGCANVVVTSNDAQHFSRLEGYFDLVVADAPCSGSGLFRRDPDAVGEWSPEAVQLCSKRQQRILADILPALKKGGVLIYSTCSYSVEEDEQIADWLTDIQGMQPLSLSVTPGSGIVESRTEAGAQGYRFYPDKVAGEGFFLSCFRKESGGSGRQPRIPKMEKATAREKATTASWLNGGPWEIGKHQQFLFALPETLSPDLALLQSALYIQYAGLYLGEIIRDKLIPDHPLALSPALAPGLPSVALDYDTAIRYLQRAEFSLPEGPAGWLTVTYKGFPLGWVNALKNRVNNYYPKELRILKQLNDRPFEK